MDKLLHLKMIFSLLSNSQLALTASHVLNQNKYYSRHPNLDMTKAYMHGCNFTWTIFCLIRKKGVQCRIKLIVLSFLLKYPTVSQRVHFFGKNPNLDSESKSGFFVSLAKSKKGLWIQWIRMWWRFNGLIRIWILRIHNFCVSLGKD